MISLWELTSRVIVEALRQWAKGKEVLPVHNWHARLTTTHHVAIVTANGGDQKSKRVQLFRAYISGSICSIEPEPMYWGKGFPPH